MSILERERKIDINQLSQEQIDSLSQQVGDKIRQLCDETANKVNAILNIYGMSAKIAIAFSELSNNSNKLEGKLKEDLSKSKKRGRKPKQKQS